MQTFQDILRRLAVNDRQFLAEQLSRDRGSREPFGLEDRTRTIARVAALVACDGSVHTFRWTIDDAIAAGVTPEEIVGILLAVAPLVGMARIVNIATKVALALDYDLDAALEVLEP